MDFSLLIIFTIAFVVAVIKLYEKTMTKRII